LFAQIIYYQKTKSTPKQEIHSIVEWKMNYTGLQPEIQLRNIITSLGNEIGNKKNTLKLD